MRPPAGKRQRRRLPARDRDLRAGRDVLEQRREHVQTGRIGDGVQIVEHQHQRALERSQRAPETRGRASTRSIRPGPTARRTPRAGAVRRGGSPPRRSAGTPRRRRLGRRARPTRTDADRPRPTAQAASSCRTRRARPRSRTARATSHSRAITSAFATVPGRANGAASLTSARSKGSVRDGHPHGRSYGQDRPRVRRTRAPFAVPIFMPSV